MDEKYTQQELERFMEEAFVQAKLARDDDEVPVGAILVDRKSRLIVGRAYNLTNASRNGTNHCEILMMKELSRNETPAEGLDLFVTCEPCIMCTSALSQYGINRAFYGCKNDKFGGCGSVENIHVGSAGESLLECYGGILEERAVKLLRDFYATGNALAPETKRQKPLRENIEAK